MRNVVIADALRTPVGTFSGTLSAQSAADLGSLLIRKILEKKPVPPENVSEVIMGQVLTADQGQNPARQAALKAGLPHAVPAMTVNQVCGSGLRAVALANAAIRGGDSDVVVAGGQENMSLAPHVVYMRRGVAMGPAQLTDTMVNDGLWCAFGDTHMGITAENIAEKYGISRKEQDEFAARSQNKAEAAIQSGRMESEILPVKVKRKKEEILFERDEHPRFGTTPETLAKLRPAFKKDGTVTAGNASGINDGAAAVLLMDEKKADSFQIEPMARIVSWAHAGVDPAIMGTGPIPASRLALERAGWTHSELDLIEANEAFAAQAIVVNREMGWDTEKVNVNGGAIALGHPIGASGARILVTLVHEMKRRDVKKGLATLCVGGGMGVAMCVER